MSCVKRVLDVVAGMDESSTILRQTCLLADDAHLLESMAAECAGPVLEIGTKHGLTAALFALMGHDVVTVDVVPSPYRRLVWEACGVNDRIVSVANGTVPPVVGGYRTAFVDAVHSYEGCARHWADIREHLAEDAVLLFDDMDYRGGEGGRFWVEMGAEQVGRFGRLVAR